jgi:hypothetical protein
MDHPTETTTAIITNAAKISSSTFFLHIKAGLGRPSECFCPAVNGVGRVSLHGARLREGEEVRGVSVAVRQR